MRLSGSVGSDGESWHGRSQHSNLEERKIEFGYLRVLILEEFQMASGGCESGSVIEVLLMVVESKTSQQASKVTWKVPPGTFLYLQLPTFNRAAATGMPKARGSMGYRERGGIVPVWEKKL